MIYLLFPVDLTSQLSSNGGGCSELAGRVVEMMEVFPPLDQSSRQHTNTSLQLHTMAITLWNLAVTMKTKENTSNELNAQCEIVALDNRLKLSLFLQYVFNYYILPYHGYVVMFVSSPYPPSEVHSL